jgi:hypothetical protein
VKRKKQRMERNEKRRNSNGRSLARLLRCSSVAGLSDMLPPRTSQAIQISGRAIHGYL